MSGYTKYNLETAIKNGYRIAEDFAASRVMFEKKYYQSNNTWLATIDWTNGNFQELDLKANNQWVQMLNPGPAGIYYLLFKKGSSTTYRALFGDGSDRYTNIKWLGEAWSDNYLISMGTGASVLITFLWDGTNYYGYIIPKTVVGQIPKHGYFYNWDVVNSGKLEIPGWRIPSLQDWSNLNTGLMLLGNSGTQLKAQSPIWNGTDNHDFTAHPTGKRLNDGSFADETSGTFYWSSSPYSTSQAYAAALSTGSSSFPTSGIYNKKDGHCVRLIRNGVSGYNAGEKIQDIDGNIYDTKHLFWYVGDMIYSAVWMLQNLAVTKYNDGESFPYIQSDYNWSIWGPARCSYNGNLQNVFE